MRQYPIEIVTIAVAAGYSYRGKHTDAERGQFAMRTLTSAEFVAGRGIVGDRYLDHGDDDGRQISFLAMEVYEALQQAVAHPNPRPGPEVLRRNVIVRGVDLRALIDQEFLIGDCVFHGVEHCSPCWAMDREYAPGALKALVGRGGLRARITRGGSLRIGPNTLRTSVVFDAADAAAPLR